MSSITHLRKTTELTGDGVVELNQRGWWSLEAQSHLPLKNCFHISPFPTPELKSYLPYTHEYSSSPCCSHAMGPEILWASISSFLYNHSSAKNRNTLADPSPCPHPTSSSPKYPYLHWEKTLKIIFDHYWESWWQQDLLPCQWFINFEKMYPPIGGN